MQKVEYLLILLIAAAVSCKKPYNPPTASTLNSYLVVEGFINSGRDSTIIKLSRTVNLASKVSVKPELNAMVTLQGDQNTSYPLIETGNGNYVCAGLNLDNTHKYRLSIVTANKKQYLSDYTAVLNSPPIDSISYDTQGALEVPGLNIYVNTHDPAGKVLYYRWDYQETWIFYSFFNSEYKSNGDTVLSRDGINDNINICWHSDTSSTLVLGSAAKLSKDVIAGHPIVSVTSTSEKLHIKYSIWVRQYALTADAYTFYTNLKTTTEQLGSIFDAEPSQISGNIHAVANPSEPVIGYVSIGSTSSLRIFIPKQVLPAWTSINAYPGCKLSLDPNDPLTGCCYYRIFNTYGLLENEVNEYINYNIGGDTQPLIPIDLIGHPGGPPLGYTATTRECADCTLRGTNKKPTFWQ